MFRTLTVLAALMLSAPLVVTDAAAGPPSDQASGNAKTQTAVAAKKTRDRLKYVAKKCKENEVNADGHLRTAAIASLASRKAWDDGKYPLAMHLTLRARVHTRKGAEACKVKSGGDPNDTPKDEELAAEADKAEADALIEEVGADAPEGLDELLAD